MLINLRTRHYTQPLGRHGALFKHLCWHDWNCCIALCLFRRGCTNLHQTTACKKMIRMLPSCFTATRQKEQTAQVDTTAMCVGEENKYERVPADTRRQAAPAANRLPSPPSRILLQCYLSSIALTQNVGLLLITRDNQMAGAPAISCSWLIAP